PPLLLPRPARSPRCSRSILHQQPRPAADRRLQRRHTILSFSRPHGPSPGEVRRGTTGSASVRRGTTGSASVRRCTTGSSYVRSCQQLLRPVSTWSLSTNPTIPANALSIACGYGEEQLQAFALEKYEANQQSAFQHLTMWRDLKDNGKWLAAMKKNEWGAR
uniref:Uncharacterized protein n=1 Tax=Aegilops tauschii subsp. strangulata TaxID=200361 RepID=A0A453MK07_AEGTS